MNNTNGFAILAILFLILSAMLTAVIAITLYYQANLINKQLLNKINHAPEPEVIIEECPEVEIEINTCQEPL